MTVAFDLSVPSRGLQVQGELLPGITGLMGANGAGKTSLVLALAGLLPYQGHVTLDGVALPAAPERRHVGVAFQDLRLFPHLSVRRNLAYGSRAPIEPLCEQLGLTPLLDRRIPTLSGGEAQRVAIARALATRPRWMLLDEPFSALDPAGRRELLPWLRRALSAAGVPCLLISHRPDDLLQIADRLWRLDGGHRYDAAPLDAEDPAAVTQGRDAGLDMVLSVAPTGPRTATVGGVPLRLPPRPEGATAVALRPEDVLVTRPPYGPTSARNALDGIVHAIVPHGAERLVQIDAGPRWTAALTQDAVDELGLAQGVPVRCLLKTTAFRWL